MPGKREISEFFAALCILAGLSFALAFPVYAQSGFQTQTTINAPPTRSNEPRRTRGLPAPPPDDSAEARNAGRSPNGIVGGFTTRVSPVIAQPPATQQLSPGDNSVSQGSLFLRPSTVRTERDGSDSARSVEDEDNNANLGPTVTDQRSATDSDPFVQPPAGYDPSIFQSEISPILDRRPGQLARFEPYAPIGIKAGSFIILPEVEVGGAWYSNIFNAPAANSDRGIELRPSVRIVSNWRRHAFEFSANAGLTFLDEFNTEDERSYRLESRGRLDITRRTNVESLFAYDVTQESRGTADATVGGSDRADVTTITSAWTLNHRFNRLSVQLRGGIEDEDTEDASAVGGGTINNDDQDFTEVSGATRLSWEFKPTLFIFGEVGVARRSFDVVAVSDGIKRDADGQRYRVGLSFGNTSELLRGEISIGYGREDLDDSRLSDVEGILVDANLAWRPTSFTSLLLTAQSDIATTRIAGTGGARDNQVGIELRHAPRRNIITSAGISYNRHDYDAIRLLEQTWVANASAEYFANRNTSLFARYQHTWFDTTSAGGNYDADEFRVGVRLQH